MSSKPELECAALLADIEANGWHLAVAESLTGGLLAAAITSVPGSSRVFLGGVVAYQSAAKAALVGVAETTLRQHGAVSAEVAIELAAGVAKKLAATNQLAPNEVVGISTTGVAGPDEQEGKSVGTVFVATALPGQEPKVRALHLAGNRTEIRVETVNQAIALAREQILQLRR